MKRMVAFTLAGVLALSMLGGCGNGNSSGSTSGTGNAGGTAEAGNDEIVTIKWYQYLDTVEPDTEMVIEALNEYTREKIGVEVEYTSIGFPDYSDKMPTLINAGEYFDICFTANWTTRYQQFTANGAFLDITELLPQSAPETYDFIPEELWKAASIDGKIYGVPSYKEMGWQTGFVVNADMADEYGIDLSQVKTLEDFTEVLKTVKEKSMAEGKDIRGAASVDFKGIQPFECLTGNAYLPGAYAVSEYNNYEGQDGVFNQYATQDYMDYCLTVRDWYLNGYLGDDPVNYSSDLNNELNDFDNGTLFSRFVQYAPGLLQTEEKRSGHRAVLVPMMEPLFDTQGSLGGLLAVSSASEHPDKALELINLINTDLYVGTLLRHGIEDVHYTAVGEDRVDSTLGGTITSDENGYDYGIGWQFGTVFNQKWDISYPEDVVEQYQAFNEAAVAAPHLGFSLDTVPVETEIAALNGVVEEYRAALELGMVDPEEYIPKFLKDLEANGMSVLLEEIDAQLGEFE